MSGRLEGGAQGQQDTLDTGCYLQIPLLALPTAQLLPQALQSVYQPRETSLSLTSGLHSLVPSHIHILWAPSFRHYQAVLALGAQFSTILSLSPTPFPPDPGFNHRPLTLKLGSLKQLLPEIHIGPLSPRKAKPPALLHTVTPCLGKANVKSVQRTNSLPHNQEPQSPLLSSPAAQSKRRILILSHGCVNRTALPGSLYPAPNYPKGHARGWRTLW